MVFFAFEYKKDDNVDKFRVFLSNPGGKVPVFNQSKIVWNFLDALGTTREIKNPSLLDIILFKALEKKN